MSTNTPGKALSITVLKVLLWIGGGIFLFLAVNSLLIYFKLNYGTAKPPLDVPQEQISTQSRLKYQISLESINLNEFKPASAHVEITRVIRPNEFGNSCFPSRYETGIDRSIKELPKVQISAYGEVTFIATYDYINNKEYNGKDACDYGISGAQLTIRSERAIFSVLLSPKDFDDFGRGDKSIVLFCISGNDLAYQSSRDYCRSNLNDLPVDIVLKYHPTFIVKGDFH